MRTLLEYIDQKTLDYEQLALFEFMRDSKLSVKERLAFVPCLAHFVMTFADIYALVLREEPAKDRYQEIVNSHTYEDGGHWKWFLADLTAFGHDPCVPFSDALRFVWGEHATQNRMLSYRICRMGLGANSLQKLVLVHCIEATGKVSLTTVAPLGRSFASELGRKAVYFGPLHIDTERDHTLEEAEVRRSLEAQVLDPHVRAELMLIVDQTFAAFTSFSDELLRFARQPTSLTAPAAAHAELVRPR
jgi:hypothetical protein